MGTQGCIRKETDGTGDGAAVYPPRPVVLAIDDEPGVRESLQLILQDEFEVLEAPDGAAALAILGARRVDVALLDVRMPGEPGSKVLPRIFAIDETIPVILITADPHLRMAVDAMKAGAYDYLAKPWDVDEILNLVREAARQRGLERELRYLRAEFDRTHGFDQLVGRHPKMVRLYETIAQVAQTPATVLVNAESGTGKELVARAIHNQSPRRDQPFVAVNLAAIPDTLLESELFGHEKGAFTGAHSAQARQVRAGPRRDALPRRDRQPARRPPGQAAARAPGARDRAARRHPHHPGGRARDRGDQHRPAPGDAGPRVPRGPLLPPARGADRRPAAARAQERHPGPGRPLHPRSTRSEFKKGVRGLSRGALLALDGYDWPGNVRELENIIERSVALATRPVIGLDDLPLDLAMNEVAPGRGEGEAPLTLKAARDRFEQAYVLRALEREDWNQSRAARGLGVHRNTLIARLAAWGFRRGERGISIPPAAGADGAT